MVVGDEPSAPTTRWVRFPASYQNGQFVVEVRTYVSGSAFAILEPTWDLDSPSTVVNQSLPMGVGTVIANFTTGVGPWVRLTFGPSLGTLMTVSAWLTPKVA